jgi:hypothetical protein
MSSVNGCERQTDLDASPQPEKERTFASAPRSPCLEATVELRRLLERTTATDVADAGRRLPNLLVRRLEKLELTVGVDG